MLVPPGRFVPLLILLPLKLNAPAALAVGPALLIMRLQRVQIFCFAFLLLKCNVTIFSGVAAIIVCLITSLLLPYVALLFEARLLILRKREEAATAQVAYKPKKLIQSHHYLVFCSGFLLHLVISLTPHSLMQIFRDALPNSISALMLLLFMSQLILNFCAPWR